MSLYVIEEKLTTTIAEKAKSWGLASVITAGLIFILYFLHITVPNPPYEVKQGVVELDFGMPENSFGQPDQGGPSPTPPAPGGEVGGGSNSPQAGGYGEIVKNEGEKESSELPEYNPPSSQNSGDPRLGRLGKIGQRTGNGQPGSGGLPGGKGTTGSGSGGNTGGVTGTGGRGGGGGGIYSYSFNTFKLSSTVTKVNADGEGNIVCRVWVDCAGRFTVQEYGTRGTTYNGSVANMRQVFDYFMSHSTFTSKSSNCEKPESGLVTLVIKSTI
jgi:hypothetical protein